MEAQLGALRGESARIVAIRAQVAQLLARQTGARRFPPILILGETGTGKGLVARTIHQAGPRRAGPFVDVNCAAIPETLLEAELFGYERGAFTDARQAKPGLFQIAHGGTLFLDEIGLLPVALQSKLLTVLEDRAVRRLGSTRAEPVDVTLVAATSVDLKRAVTDGRFREDLYHRLAVITLELPPLRSRGADVLALADHFLARACDDYGLSPRVLTPDARDLLAAHRWPGNVRELANAMERVVLLSETDEIPPAMLGFLTNDAAQTTDTAGAVEAGDAGAAGSLDDALRARIEAGLRDTGGKIRRTAAALGISRNTLRARMDKYGLRHHDTPPAISRKAPELPAATHQPVPMQWEHRHLAFLRVRLLTSRTVEASRALEVVGEKVRSFGGRIEEASPTGVIAVFGLEPADNAPSHAALAALAIQKAAVHIRVAGGASVEIVSALHCANLLVGRQQAALQVGVDGKAAIWSLLETLVADETQGAIVVSGPVVPFLARRFALESLRDTSWRLLRREEPSAGWSATRFVGRTPELHTLHQEASRVEQRHGQLVGIVGEAGVGKSRLVHEATRQLKGWLVLSSGGAPYAKNTPYFPLVDLFKSFGHIHDSDTPSEVRERVARALPAEAGDPDVLLAPMLDLLGVLPPKDAFRDLDPQQRRQRIRDAIIQVLLGASVAQPLCLIIEDLHWIDAETQAFLDNLVERLPAARVLLLVNYRPEYQHPWSGKTYYRLLRIDALPPDSADELLGGLLGKDPGLGPLKRLLIERTGGNPFFLEESVTTLAETDVIVGERGSYRLSKPMAEILVPSTVQAVLAARIDRLYPEDKRLLQSASVIGKDLPFVLLQAMADASPDELHQSLQRLQAAEFLYEVRLFPELEFTFRHALTHVVVYDSLLPERRQVLHGQVLYELERLYSDRMTERVETLGDHALRGELWEKAVNYLRLAAHKAHDRWALGQAIVHIQQAIGALERRPACRARDIDAIELRLELHQYYYLRGSVAQSTAILQEAERFAETSGATEQLARIVLFKGENFRLAGDFVQAFACLERARTLAAADNAPLSAAVLHGLGMALHGVGRYTEAVDTLRAAEAAPQAVASGRRFAAGSPEAGRVANASWLVRSLAVLGRFDEAIRKGEQMLAAAERLTSAVSMVQATFGLGEAYRERGDWTRAITLLERSVAAAQDGGLGVITAAAGSRLGAAYAHAGRLDEALKLLRASASVGSRAPNMRSSAFACLLGEACLLSGNIDEARLQATTALEAAQALQQRGDEAAARWLLGLTTPSMVEAEVFLSKGLSLGSELGMRPLVAHCHLGLGRLYWRGGKRQEAQEHLATAANMYGEMGMTYWVGQAATELATPTQE